MSATAWLELKGTVMTDETKKAIMGYYKKDGALAKPLRMVCEWLNLDTGARIALVGPEPERIQSRHSFRVFHFAPGAELSEISRTLFTDALDFPGTQGLEGRLSSWVGGRLGIGQK